MTGPRTIESDSIYLEPAENGYILYYTVCYSVGMGSYDRMNKYDVEKEVFKRSEASQALKRMDEIFKMSGEEIDEKDEA